MSGAAIFFSLAFPPGEALSGVDQRRSLECRNG